MSGKELFKLFMFLLYIVVGGLVLASGKLDLLWIALKVLIGFKALIYCLELMICFVILFEDKDYILGITILLLFLGAISYWGLSPIFNLA